MKIYERIQIRDVVKKTIIAATNAAHNNENSGNELTHAWIFEGPEGSGNTELATAFAASIICPNKGCGDCIECITILSGNHLDVEIYKPKGQAIKINDVRELINRSSFSPSIGGWRVIIIEEASNLTDSSANALLGAIEDSSNRTIWALCANSVTEIIPTLRSRCRIINFLSPTAKSIESYLTSKLGIDKGIAANISKYAQGNLNRAVWLAQNPASIQRRNTILELVSHRMDISESFRNAGVIIELSTKEAEAIGHSELDEIIENPFQIKNRENQISTHGSRELKLIEKQKKAVIEKEFKDSNVQLIIDLISLYRDVLVNKMNANVDYINPTLEKEIFEMANENTSEAILNKLNNLVNALSKLKTTAAPQILLESLMISLN